MYVDLRLCPYEYSTGLDDSTAIRHQGAACVSIAGMALIKMFHSAAIMFTWLE